MVGQTAFVSRCVSSHVAMNVKKLCSALTQKFFFLVAIISNRFSAEINLEGADFDNPTKQL